MLSQEEMLELFRSELRKELGSAPDAHAPRWLGLSKAIDANPAWWLGYCYFTEHQDSWYA